MPDVKCSTQGCENTIPMSEEEVRHSMQNHLTLYCGKCRPEDSPPTDFEFDMERVVKERRFRVIRLDKHDVISAMSGYGNARIIRPRKLSFPERYWLLDVSYDGMRDGFIIKVASSDFDPVEPEDMIPEHCPEGVFAEGEHVYFRSATGNENPRVHDPVHRNPGDNQWYFWDETWADRHGPFMTREECETALKKYADTYL